MYDGKVPDPRPEPAGLRVHEPLSEALLVNTEAAAGDLVLLIGKTGLGTDQADTDTVQPIGGDLLLNWLRALARDPAAHRATLIFVNSAVLLTREGSECGRVLALLSENGSRLVADGQSLDHYGLSRSSMAEQLNSVAIMQLILKADRVITLP